MALNIARSKKVFQIPELSTEVEIKKIPHPEIAGIYVCDKLENASLLLAINQYRLALENPGCLFVWPTGNTQIPVYKFLVKIVQKTGINPFLKIYNMHLDEYYPAPGNENFSFVKYLKDNFSIPLSINNFDFINGTSDNCQHEAIRYEKLFQNRRIKCVTFGTDPEEGHIAFIPPGTPFSQKKVFCANLASQTLKRDRIERKLQTPARAITVGFGILKSDHIFLIAQGNKGKIINQAFFNSDITPKIPLTALRKYGKKVTVFLDHDAAGFISQHNNND